MRLRSIRADSREQVVTWIAALICVDAVFTFEPRMAFMTLLRAVSIMGGMPFAWRIVRLVPLFEKRMIISAYIRG